MNEKPKHTPGPWHKSPAFRRDGNHPGIDIGAHNGANIALVHHDEHDRDERETIANADLIYAAPKMLAKLKKVSAWLTKLADKAEVQAEDCRFPSLAKAYEDDAKNYRATAADLNKVIALAEGSEAATDATS